MTEEAQAGQTAIICASNQSLKSVFRDGGRHAGIASAMLLDKTSEAIRALKDQPKAWLLVDYQIPTEDLAKILSAAQGPNSLNTRPIYLVANDFHSKLVEIALEFNVAKLRFGDINAQGIEKDLKDLGEEVAKRAPIADAISKAQKFVAEKKFSEASATFLSLLETQSANASVVIEYIDFLIFTNDLERAKKYLEDAQLLEPDDIRLKHLQARYYMRTKNFDEGIRLLESLNTKNPWSPNRLIELGNALLATSRFSEARERFDRALILNPSSEAAKSGKAQSVLLGGDVQEGLMLLKDLGPPRQMASTLNAAAVFAARTDRVDDARNLYERGIQLLQEDPPSSGRLWFNLGILEHRSGKLERALKCFQNAMIADPKFADAKHNYNIVKQLLAGGALDEETISRPANVKTKIKTIEIPAAGPAAKAPVPSETPILVLSTASRDLDESPVPISPKPSKSKH